MLSTQVAYGKRRVYILCTVCTRCIYRDVEYPQWITLACFLFQGEMVREISAMTRRQGSAVTAICADEDCNVLITGDNSTYTPCNCIHQSGWLSGLCPSVGHFCGPRFEPGWLSGFSMPCTYFDPGASPDRCLSCGRVFSLPIWLHGFIL